MISERLCDWSNDAKNVILKYIQIENSYFSNISKNNSKCTVLLYFGMHALLNAGLVNRRDFFKKTLTILLFKNFWLVL